MGWLNQVPKDSHRREVGHKIDWLKYTPSDSFCSDAGHTTLTMDWLKRPSNDSCCSEGGQLTPAMGGNKTRMMTVAATAATHFRRWGDRNYTRTIAAAMG